MGTYYDEKTREEEDSFSWSEEEEDDDDSSDEININGVRGEKWIEHYSSSHRILLVGEGDFSFSLCLARAFASARSMVATSLDTHQNLAKKYSNATENVRQLEEMGCIVLCGVDAKEMSQHHFLKTQRFHRIVYNFPHVGFKFPEGNGCQIKLSKRLVKGFMRNAKVLLRKEGGEIHVTQKDGDPYNKWDLVKKAEKIGLMLHKSIPFCRNKLNKQLVKGFMRNAKVLLRKDGGEIHVTHKDGDPYNKWDLVKKAEKIGLMLHESIPFCKNKYPGYDNKRAQGNFSDAPFHLGDCTTFKFRLALSS